ncbi:glycosyltransferase involved in cell wall biosynthesis [Arthrobacter sp. CAN_A6]|uniref:glycosyltransferase family 2 protein n=1 Tax=Arthrobacter sp. CAN_A6 TaxID=2787721 RepID=UPI0018C941F3
MSRHPLQCGDPVDVIIATRDRHDLLVKSLDCILGQTYAGRIRATVVYDKSRARLDLAMKSPTREIRVLSNRRTSGLAGARNSGLLASDSPLVAFCDDDDQWRPDKLERQLKHLIDEKATACVSGIEIHYGDKRRIRIPAVQQVTLRSLSGSRLTGAHPSTFLFDREHLLAEVGLVDEALPHGYGEDYDLLLRIAAAGKVTVLPEATVDVLWHPGGSYFSQRWEAMAEGLDYLMRKHPVLLADRRGRAWMQGQRAFALAALGGQPAEAVRVARASLRHSLMEPRAYLAIAVALGVVKPAVIVDALNARGRGI